MGVVRAIFTPVKSKRTFEEVSSKIKNLIFDGTLKPGDRLPSESELAVQFGVGRQTLREALRILELSGFIFMRKEKTFDRINRIIRVFFPFPDERQKSAIPLGGKERTLSCYVYWILVMGG